ncbi:cell envelope integrity protein CreD [Permianibacter sp. IMCC34836]|uniref:cell envelope integrity protein CreD n=1 Tax=Permianibacter fluminis TaxID=2738515 RepID=UPI0015573D51|nr:cell envelope integrity protein CreD [Permianibacter fluminis]NQD36392.1 cell envelope integrity protein CreD [Permianibacter fluminis]
MQWQWLFKAGALFFLFLVLQIPLIWTQDLVQERSNFRQQAIDSVSQSNAGTQAVVAPVLIVPFEHRYWADERDKDDKPIRVQRTRAGKLSFLPRQLQVDSKVDIEQKPVGIFQVPVYRAALQLTGDFELPADYGVTVPTDEQYLFDTPYLALSVSEQRGIKQLQMLQWNAAPLAFEPGSRLPLHDEQGVHANLPPLQAGGPQHFVISLQLQGLKTLSVVPVADNTSWSLGSSWPHARFWGNATPDQKDLREDGLDANWQTSVLATNMPSRWQNCMESERCDDVLNQAFSVDFLDPVDVYVKSDRATKYAFLFVGITFGAFLLFEIMKQLAIHPVQYGMVGLALAFFFLLLLSLSEHIAFVWAYLIAAAGCIGVIIAYLSAVLRSVLTALGFGVALAVLYGALYLILGSEDFALLIGSGLLFGLLTLAMLLTRKVDWYHLQQRVLTPRSSEAR